ncbi:high nitrogen upregulated cytochrome P450 monooxygenase 2 [Earliella scabrosa]|nr:high nitrogen upregulated cytochrome P450 monooxygenase 2 [Earliella scabrosa]
MPDIVLHNRLPVAVGGILEPRVMGTMVILGVISHQVLRKYETFSVTAHFALLVLSPCFAYLSTSSRSSSFSFQELLLCLFAHAGTVLMSAMAYRLSPLHPLAHYPGPVQYRISKLVFGLEATRGYSHYRLKDLHARYGDVVRIGPNELSINDVDAIGPVLGSTGLPKSTAYMGGTLGRGRDDIDGLLIGVDEHLRRRRAWNRGLSTAAVREYEGLIAARARLFIERLGQQVGEISLDKWINYFSYDFMCDMTYGGGSELLKEGDTNHVWSIVEEGLVLSHLFAHLPWLGVYVGKIPGAAGSLDTLFSFAREFASQRLRHGSASPDLFHYLNNDDLPQKDPPREQQLLDDSFLAIVAGADTSSSALTSLFFLLGRHPEVHASIQTEVDRFFPNGDNPLSGDYRDMHYLNAVINETLRMYPPVPKGGLRRVPHHGDAIIIGSTVLPPGTSVWINVYCLHHDARNFSLPDLFWPERWLVASGHLALEDALRKLPASSPSVREPSAASSPLKSAASAQSGSVLDFEFVHNEVAFIPFSYGPMNCAGKYLAMMEMRMVVCAFVQKFDFKLREGWDAAEFETGYKDYFVAGRPKVPVLLEARF